MTNKGFFLLTALLTIGMTGTTWANFGVGLNLDDPLLTFDKASTIQADTLPPIEDRDSDAITNDTPTNPFDLDDPPAIETEVTYDPETGYYIITEKVGDAHYRPPTYMTFDEYMEWSADNDKNSYFNQLSDRLSLTGDAVEDPVGRYKEAIRTSLINRLFGGADLDPKEMVSIRPQGNIDLTFGIDQQYVENPSLTERQRRNGGFDFDMAIQMNVIGKIGDKLNLATNYNTLATFDFDNQMKLEYAGTEDEIIQRIEAGNVSLPLRSSLIQGSQSLFGIKTDLRFGRLNVSAIASQKKSKRENIQIQGGTQLQDFEVFANDYDQNRHFFLSHYNRNTYEPSLENLPQINTLFRITKMEVWITNNVTRNEGARDVIAFMDIGEPNLDKVGKNVADDANYAPPVAPRHTDLYGNGLPANNANGLYQSIIDKGVSIRNGDMATLGLTENEDYGIIEQARPLSPSEYTYHPELGFISLNINLQDQQMLAVSYEYTYNGEVFQVGEFPNDIPTVGSDSSNNVIFAKMLKSAGMTPELPMWDLMMKNIYSVGAYQINPQDFKLDVYYQDPGGGFIRNLPNRAGANISACNLISLLNLDNLNSVGDPFPDGVFDFVPGVTINPKNGRIIFPVLEPFGSSLEAKFEKFGEDPSGYLYNQLYDDTYTAALQFPELNRYVIRGEYKSSVSSRISLGAFNIPRGSVSVTAGGQKLEEGRDYDIDYNTGQITILNDAYLNSGLPVNVSYEDNTLFGFQTKTLYGTRLDYEVSKNFNIGGTFMHVSERPFTQKVNIGEDPISNSIYGLDLQYNKEAPGLTRFLDKLPLLQTKEKSQISFTAEGAALRPGHSRALNRVDQSEDRGGTVYIDDFEGSTTNYDLYTQPLAWAFSSTPSRFPESERINDWSYGFNRARVSWFSSFQVSSNSDDPYERRFSDQDIFPDRQSETGVLNNNFNTLNLLYYPSERGPYNFDVAPSDISAGIDVNTGALNNPEDRWGGIMRDIATSDFEAANVEYVEFWMLSPFIDAPSNNPGNGGRGGDLYLNLGNVSEDLLRDSERFFEQGLPSSNSDNRVDTTAWSRIPLIPTINNSFDYNENIRAEQDLGLDGFDDEGERIQFADYLNRIAGYATPAVSADADADPSTDNYMDPDIGSLQGLPSVHRHRFFNSPQGNSAGTVTTSATTLPDTEDINQDNTLNTQEGYYEYRIPIKPDDEDGDGSGIAPNPYIVDVTEVVGRPEWKWYQFRIPIEEFTGKVGSIQNFRSIRFMRMYATNFEEPIIMRFGEFFLVRNQWRRYTRSITGAGIGPVTDPSDPTLFDVSAVNIEENRNSVPFPYVQPPGIEREQSVGVFNTLQNEQSMAINVCNLEAGEAKAVFKPVNLDLRRYTRLKMFVHAEAGANSSIDFDDGDLSIFMRIGSDFEDNYYEYELPLVNSAEIDSLSGNINAIAEIVWPEANRFNFPLSLLRNTKIQRNSDPNATVTSKYSQEDPENMENTISIIGNPDLGYVRGVMIGLRNKTDAGDVCAEVWVNELRLSGLDERGGVAGLARLDVQLADFGNFTAAGSYTGIGWGQLEDKVDQRAKEAVVQYDFATNLELGKLLPKNTGLRIPFYAQYSTTVKTPEFDPYQLDLRLKQDVLDNTESRAERDSIRDLAVDYTSIRGFNFTNVRKERLNRERKPMPWDVENLSLTYAFDRTLKHDPTIENEEVKRYRGSVDYSYSSQLRPIAPFKNMKAQSPWLGLIRDFNFNPVPNSISIRNDLNRQFGEITYRFADRNKSTYYDKRFTWDRAYGLQWNLSKGLTMGFNAVNSSVIDELPEYYDDDDDGFPDLENGIPRRPTADEKKDEIWNSIGSGGRNKHYNHGLNVSYTLPTKQIPFLAWTKIKAQYQSSYDWSRASLNTDSLGNVIQNGQTRSITGDLDLTKLYNKSDYLKKINSKPRKDKGKKDRNRGKDDKPDRKPEKGKGKGKKDIKFKDQTTTEEIEEIVEEVIEDKKAKKERKKRERKKAKEDKKKGIGDAIDKVAKEKKEKKDREPTALERALLRPLMMIRKARVSYSENFGSVVPGFVPETRLLGQNDGFNSPGWGYVFGANYGLNWRLSDFTNWLDDTGQRDQNIVRNPFLNQQVQVRYTQTYDGQITVEPFADFRVDINAKRSFTNDHSEYYKVQVDGGDFEHLNPFDRGSLNMTYFSMRTLFGSTIDDLRVKFESFEDNREIISQRLGELDPRSDEDHEIDAQFGSYTQGYGRHQQDVLIPAFLATYTGKDPETFPLRIFDILPRPNWKLSYNGLNKIKAFSNIFASFNLSHSYTSTLAINSFATDLDFQNKLVDIGTRNYYSTYEIPDVVIREQFGPLIGVDIRFKNDLSARFNWNKSRDLRLNLNAKQLAETNSEEFTIGMGYRVKGFKLPFKIVNIKGSKEKTNELENDLNFKFDFSYRDDVTIRHLLDEDAVFPERGSRVIRISPSIDYAVNKFVNVRLFFDRSRTIPKTSQSFPITNTQGGVTIRFSLTQ